MIKDLISETNNFYQSLGEDIKYAGLRRETENFIHNVNKSYYLIKLCI